MKTYYTDTHAQHYNRTWRVFSEKTQAVTLSLFVSCLRRGAGRQQQPLRILDVGCGTGVLLAKIAQLLPEAELYGVDASQPMLNQAAHLLGGGSRVHLTRASLPEKATEGLPFPPAFFDVITCTNTLHYVVNPGAVLQELRSLLAPTGWLVMEDYILRGFPFPWKALEWAIKIYDPQHVRLYTRSTIQELCQHVDLQVLHAQTFQIDLFCQGWALLLEKTEASVMKTDANSE